VGKHGPTPAGFKFLRLNDDVVVPQMVRCGAGPLSPIPPDAAPFAIHVIEFLDIN
jgi:hypothetical protein